MSAGEGTSVGQIFGRLGFRFDGTGSQEFDRARQKHEQQTKTPINQELGFEVDDKALADYNRELDKIRARTTKRDEFKAKLGGDFDPKAFRAFEAEAAKAQREAQKLEAQHLKLAASTDRSSRSFDHGSASIQVFAQTMRGLFDQSAKITAVGVAIQGISAAGAGLGALAAGLAPAAGALAAYPALGSAAAQGLGVFKLATANVFQAVGGLNERLDTTSKKFKELDPQAQALARELDKLKQPIRDLSKEAQKGLFPGLEDGIKSASQNLPVFKKIVGDTAVVLGDFARKAGEMVGSKAWGRDLQTQGERNTVTLKRGGEVALNLADALRHVTLAAGPLVDWITRSAVTFSDLIDKQAEAGRKSGTLADFFDKTRITLDRLGRIAGDVGTALFNLAKAAYPLGNDLLKSVTLNADKFREWTESAKGANAIKDFFDRARPAAYEVGKLLVAIAQTFGRLGNGEQVAPLIHTIRTQLLPALEKVVNSTTASFGPVFLTAITQALLLFSRIAGSSGPLVEFTKLLGDILTGLNKLIDRIPAIGTALSAVIALGGIAKALQLAGAITGVNRLIGLLRVAKTEAATAGAVSAVSGAGAAGGAAGTAGRVSGIAQRASSALPIVGAVAIGALALGDEQRSRRQTQDTEALARANKALRDSLPDPRKFHDIGQALDWLNGRFHGTVEDSNAAARGMKELGLTVESSPKQIKQATDAFDSFQDRFKTTQRLLKLGIPIPVDAPIEAAKRVANALERLKNNASTSIRDLRSNVRLNMKLIASNMDTQSAEGKQALAANFEAAVASVRKSMREKTVSVREGMAEIRRLVSQELTDVYGLSLHDASNIAKGNGKTRGSFGDTDNNLGREGGAPITRAGGGWIGAPGLVGTDTVPAMLAPGEAVLNRHQQAIIEGLLGGGFLDRLFANVTTPHYLAGGGYAGVSGDTDFLPALGRALSALSRAAGTPIYVQSGRRTVAEQLAQGPSTPGHPVAGPNGPHVRGVAADITPGYSAFARLAGRFGLGFTVMPQEPWHIQLLGAAGSAAAQGATAAAASIKRVLVGGKGAMGAVAQRAVDVARAGANRFLNSPGLLSYGGGSGGESSPVAKGAFGKAALAGLWTGAGGPSRLANIAAAIALAESSGNPNAHNPSGATGLWQILGQVVPGNLYNPSVNAANAVKKWSDAHGFSPWVQYTTGAYKAFLARGGFVQRFNKGGKVKPKTKTYTTVAPGGPGDLPGNHGTLTAGPGGGFSLDRGTQRSIARGEAGITGFEDRIQREEREYSQMDREFGLTDEVFLIQNDDGSTSVDTGAVAARLRELGALVAKRLKIKKLIKDYRAAIKKLVDKLRGAIDQLTVAANSAKGKARAKERGGYRAAIATYQQRITELGGVSKDLGLDLEDQRIDLEELGNEQKAVGGTTGAPAPASTSSAASVGLTADQQAQLDQADTLKRIVDTGAFLNDSAVRTLSLFDPNAVGRASAAAGGSSFPASSGGGMTLADGTVVPAGQSVVIVQQTINTLHPADPATLQAVARAANAGNSYLGFVPASNVNLGV
jgi:hypothetical protein